jgi:hypothetical protein
MLEQAKSRRSIARLATFAAVAGLAACSAGTQASQAGGAEKAEDETVELTPQVLAVQDLALAHQLAEYGERTNDPVALASAAQILINTPRAELEGEPEAGMSDRPETGAKEDAETEEMHAAELLTQARSAASGNQELLETIGRIEARAQTAQRGAVGGAREGMYRVERYSTNTHRISFRAGEPAAVYINGDDDTDLDLYVYDENGNLIDSDIGYTDEGLVEWRPRWTGEFRIEVRNLGGIWNGYYFATN